MESLTDFSLDEIDDKEFAIPTIVGPLPTLESILNEEDNDSVESDLDPNETNNGIDWTLNEFLDSIENSSISSLDSRGFKRSTNALQSKDTNKNHLSIEGSIIRHSVLKSLSAQLKSANTDRINAGKPTVLTISSIYVAVGTSHGFVLVFDLRQVMKSCLRINEDSGSVSAMSIKRDNSRLLCGYSRGSVSLWNLQSGELIKIFNELHSPQTTVLHLKYLSDNNFGALSDSSGSVFMLDFRRKDIDSQCIFSGSRGEVLAIEPLLVTTPSNKEVINFNNICLLSMATVTKVIALSVRPTIVVHFTQILKGYSDTLPLLCWQFVMVQISENNRVIDPVLSFGRQNTIYFFQASFKTSSKVLFTPLMQISVGYIIQSMVWLNSRTMVTIDEFEKMHVLDVRSEEEIEVIEADKIQMVYASALFKSIDNGSNVSPAMSAGAERACYHSICVSNNSISNSSSSNLLILGVNSVHLFAIRSWAERIDLLVKENKFEEALRLTLSFYNNTAKAVIGLSGKKSEKRKIVSQKMFEVLNKYVDSGLTTLCPENGKIESLFDHFRQLIPTSVDYCLAIESNRYLLNDLFDKFSDDSIAKNIFLDALEPHILKGELKNLSPILAKELITLYEERKWFHNLESVVLNLEITCLDIHHVMTICQKHSLFDAIIYIDNNAFDDYVTSFDQLIQRLQLCLNSGNELTDELGVGNKLLNYMDAILRGRSYPYDKELEPEKKLPLIKEMMSRITRVDKSYNSKHNLKAFAADIYPNLKTILSFNTKHFLNILSNAFESFDPENSYLIDQKQQMVNILVRVMVESPGFDDNQIGALFIFIAKLLSTKRNTISIDNTLMDQILQYLFQSQEVLWFEERQQVLLELLQSDTGLAVDELKIIDMAKEAKFFRICEYIYIKNRNWGENISCYIYDSNRQSHVFSYIQQILMSSNVTEEEKRVFKQFIYSKIDCLTEIDNRKTAKLVLNDLDIDRFEDILNSLKTYPKVLYKLLFGVLLGMSSKTHKRDPSTGSINFESLSLREQRRQTLITDPKIQEKFIELMSELEPKLVFKTLNILEDYRSDVVLVCCKKHEINDATAYLLEKTSRFDEAFNMLYKDLNQMIKELNASEIESSWTQIESRMTIIIDFCRRCSFKMTETTKRDNFWMSLINSMVTINQLMKSSAKTHPMKRNICNDLNKLMNKLIESINNTTNLTSIMETMVNDPSFLVASGGTLCDLRELFTIVYENYNYEETLLLTTNNLLLNELHQHFIHLKKDVNKGNTNRYKTCGVCSKALHIEDNILFHCSHSFHHKCVAIRGKQPNCLICEPSTDDNPENVETSHRLSLSYDSNQTICDQKSKNPLKLSESQMKALEYLRSGQRIDSRAKILNHLPNTRIQVMASQGPTDDIFKLNLAPNWRQISHS